MPYREQLLQMERSVKWPSPFDFGQTLPWSPLRVRWLTQRVDAKRADHVVTSYRRPSLLPTLMQPAMGTLAVQKVFP